jgi:hypothetical protein
VSGVGLRGVSSVVPCPTQCNPRMITGLPSAH